MEMDPITLAIIIGAATGVYSGELIANNGIKNITENFTFDNLNRLTTATVNGVQQFAISCDGTTSSSYFNT